MELLDLYVNEVGLRLPEKQREDIKKEIRSMILDALEDERAAAGMDASDNDTAALMRVLERLDPPEKIAASYLPTRYLIGPNLYPHFITTLKIVLTVILVLAVVGLGISLGWSARLPEDVARIFGQAASGLFSSVWTVLGIIVFIFAIIQRVEPEFKAREQPWDPRKLHASTVDERVKTGELIAEAVMSVLLIIFLNTYPRGLVFFSTNTDLTIIVPALTATFMRFLPWLTALWALQAALNILLVGRGHWQPATRWLTIGLSAANIVLAVIMLLGPDLVVLSSEALANLANSGVAAVTIETLKNLTADSIRIVLGIIIAAEFIEIGSQVYKLYRARIPVLA